MLVKENTSITARGTDSKRVWKRTNFKLMCLLQVRKAWKLFFLKNIFLNHVLKHANLSACVTWEVSGYISLNYLQSFI